MKLSLITEVNLNQLSRKNKAKTNERARNPKIKIKLKAYNKASKKARFLAEGLTGNYAIYVDFIKPQAFIQLSRQEVKLSCSCPDFLYRCNYVLDQKHKAAERRYDNGDAPIVMNPSGEQVICKHLVKLKQEFKTLRLTENLNIQRRG